MVKMLGRIRKLIRWIRFGAIQERVVSRIEGTACEIEYTGRLGRVIGYWAYGSFDPRLPYQGE